MEPHVGGSRHAAANHGCARNQPDCVGRAGERRHRVPPPDIHLRWSPRAERRFRGPARGVDNGGCGSDGLGQVDTTQSSSAPARPAAGHRVHRRRRCSEIPPVLRGLIGFVPQEPFLFGATIAENIAFGADGRQDHRERVEQGASIARLDKDVAAFPNRYDTTIGERDYPVRRSEAAHCHCTRAARRSEDSHSRRCAVGGGYLYGGGNSRSASRNDAPADIHHRFASRVDRSARRSDSGS